VSKPKLLTFIGCYLPGYRAGGPIRSIANQVERLGDEFEFRIVTTDKDLGDDRPYSGVKIDDWNEVGRAHVFYASPRSRTFARLVQLVRQTDHDILYVNSFFDPVFSIQLMLARRLHLLPRRPTILAPRGEFSPGAYRMKAWKKVPFTFSARCIGLHGGILWHSSTEQEASDIRRVLGAKDIEVGRTSNIAVAPDLVGSPEQYSSGQTGPEGKQLSICFLSRVCRMKNLDYVLNVLSQVTATVRLEIYGPLEDQTYWAECQTLMSRLPANVSAAYCGSVEHSEVLKTIGRSHLLFVPTRGENFGHVFHEAFAAGVPVLTSDQTPWHELQARGVGWDIPLDQPERFVAAIESAAAMSPEYWIKARKDCKAFAREQSEGEALGMNRRLFRRALGASAT
jgi:glycosyltransferase involved in cell wall biosynthesis